MLGIGNSQLGFGNSMLGTDDSQLGFNDSMLGIDNSQLGFDDSVLGIDDSQLGLWDNPASSAEAAGLPRRLKGSLLAINKRQANRSIVVT